MATSKPSSTNCPKLKKYLYVCMRCLIYGLVFVLFYIFSVSTVILGDYSTSVPPLPIPNREVKPRHADGTAFVLWESR